MVSLVILGCILSKLLILGCRMQLAISILWSALSENSQFNWDLNDLHACMDDASLHHGHALNKVTGVLGLLQGLTMHDN